MGLDMYLTKSTSFITNKPSADEINVPGIKTDRIKSIREDVGYWRKANAIHSWFVENVQDGKDDCGEYYVTQEDFENLLKVVNEVLNASKLVKGKVSTGTEWTKEGGEQKVVELGKVIKDPTVARKLLPTSGGFFFGSTDYDEYYYDDLVETKKIVEGVLKEIKENSGRFVAYYYSSSW